MTAYTAARTRAEIRANPAAVYFHDLTAEEYRGRARRCRELAKTASTAADLRALLDLADEYAVHGVAAAREEPTKP